MIPKSITEKHIIEAARRLDDGLEEDARASRQYDVIIGDRRYPPKHILSIAAELATGKTLLPDSFGGGIEANTFLGKLGFEVVEKSHTKAAPSPAPTAKKRTTKAAAPKPAAAKPVTAKPVARKGKGLTVRVGRIFLDMGATLTEFRKTSKGQARGNEFGRLTCAQFNASPTVYRQRVASLIGRARAEGADVVVLPSSALHYTNKVTIESYVTADVPWVVAGVRDSKGYEEAVVIHKGRIVERFDHKQVHWLDAGPFTMMVAISSRIADVHKGEAPALSKSSPPTRGKPLLLLDVGHQGYSGHYYSQTLRCVARDAQEQPAAVVLSSWRYTGSQGKCSWAQPEERVSERRRITTDDERDIIDIIDVDLG